MSNERIRQAAHPKHNLSTASFISNSRSVCVGCCRRARCSDWYRYVVIKHSESENYYVTRPNHDVLFSFLLMADEMEKVQREKEKEKKKRAKANKKAKDEKDALTAAQAALDKVAQKAAAVIDLANRAVSNRYAYYSKPFPF